MTQTSCSGAAQNSRRKYDLPSRICFNAILIWVFFYFYRLKIVRYWWSQLHSKLPPRPLSCHHEKISFLFLQRNKDIPICIRYTLHLTVGEI